MKMRKLFAGIAAVATLLGGMAFGAASANAADGDADSTDGNESAIVYGHTITMHSDNYNQFKKSDGSLRDYAYVKIADYVSDGHSGVTLQTVDGLKGEIAQALMEWQPGYNPQDGDPLVWLSEQGKDDNSLYRKFVEKLDASLRSDAKSFNTTEKDGDKLATPSASLDGYFNKVTFDFGDDKGLYLIFDLSGDQTFTLDGGSTETVHAMQTVMVGTSISGAVLQPDNATGEIEAKGEESTFNSDFEFTKKNRKGDTLSDAEFEIKYDSGELKGQLVYFQKTEPYYQALDYQKDSDGKYVKDENGNYIPPAGTNKVISDQNGGVQVKGLKPGWYVVTETKAPEGYSNQYLPSFKIMVNNQGIVSSYIGKDDGDPYDLVVNQNGLTVINLQKGELPKTGAAGIAMFVVVAVLLLGTAGTVYLKSRGTRRALRG